MPLFLRLPDGRRGERTFRHGRVGVRHSSNVRVHRHTGRATEPPVGGRPRLANPGTRVQGTVLFPERLNPLVFGGDAVAGGDLAGLVLEPCLLPAARLNRLDGGEQGVHGGAEEHPWGGLHEIPRVRVGVLFGGGAEQFGEFVRQIRVCAEQVRQPVVGLLRVFLRVGYLCCGRGGGGEGVGGLRQRVRRGGAQLRLCRKRCGVHISGVRPVDTLVQFLVAVGEDVVKVLKGFERVRQRRDDTGGHGGVLFGCPENVLLHLVGHADGLHLDVVAAHLLLGRVRRPLVHIVLLPISGGDGVVSHCPSCSCRRRSAANPGCPGCGAARRGSGCSTGRLGRPTRSPAPARTVALR